MTHVSTNNFYWILIVINLVESKLVIYDTMKKPQQDYQDTTDIIQR